MKPNRVFVAVLGAVVAFACGPDKGGTLRASRAQPFDRAEDGEDLRFGPWGMPTNLGPVVNSPYDDNHPAISRDGLSLYITSNRPGGVNGANPHRFVEIWVSRRDSLGADWKPPQGLGDVINITGFNTAVPNLTPDGHTLYFHSTRPGGCGGTDMYLSTREDKDDDFAWGKPVNLGCAPKGPNTAEDENGPTYLAGDGVEYLFYNTNLQTNPAGTIPGGCGGPDILMSVSHRNGNDGDGPQPFWPPGSVVKSLCSPKDDTRTAIRSDGLEIIFSSTRDGGIGKNDLWSSTRKTIAEDWSVPMNLGRPVNSEVDDGGAALSWDGTTLYFFSTRHPGDKSRTDRDLWVTKRSRLRAGFVSHVIAPQATDPAIDAAIDPHLAWLDKNARTNDQLLLFMPGHNVPRRSTNSSRSKPRGSAITSSA